MAKYSLSRRYNKIKNSINLFVNKRIKRSIYTDDLIKNKLFSVGRYTYGAPDILVFPNGETAKVTIGSFCSIAPNVQIFTGGNHRVDWISTYPFNQFTDKFPKAAGISGQPFSKGDIIIGNDVWIGQNAVILSGVIIGDGAVIGANTIVSNNVEPYEIVVGNPMKKLRKRFDDDTINKLLVIKWWNWDTDKINAEVKNFCSDNIQAFIVKHFI